jgi:16S rRNA (guanine966-N2)-methyltransferase
MRIIAGELKGRRIARPDDPRVRPITDRLKEAWFGVLGQRVVGASVVDLFAGSGALGLEALSRGAVAVDFVEFSPRSLEALRRNIAALKVGDRARVRRADALRFAGRLGRTAYDLAFADPPFSTDHAERLVAIFREHPFASTLTLQHRADRVIEGDDVRRYGTHAITFLFAP